MKKLSVFILLFIHSHMFAQNLPARENKVSDDHNKSSNSFFTSPTALKVNVFAPLLGYSQLSLEKPVRQRRNIQLGLGIIGAGMNLSIQGRPMFLFYDGYSYHHPGMRNQFGGFIELGYKFIKPVHANNRLPVNYYWGNAFGGSYLKPSILVGAYSFNQFSHDSTYSIVRRHHSFGALMLNAGHQWQFNDRILLEMYLGGGAEIDNVKDGDDLYGHPFVLAVAKDNPSVNFSCTAGFRVGYVFK
jgi:hypothetical protein